MVKATRKTLSLGGDKYKHDNSKGKDYILPQNYDNKYNKFLGTFLSLPIIFKLTIVCRVSSIFYSLFKVYFFQKFRYYF